MRTKLLSIGLALVFVFANLNIALADTPTPRATPPGRGTPPAEKGSQRRAIFGTIASVVDSTFTVSTKQGDVTVAVSNDTKFHIPTKRRAAASFADLAVGDRVAVNATLTESGLSAKQVAVAPGKPTIRHRVGTVTAYADSIIIKDAQGGTEMFVLNTQTIIRNPKGSGVKVGDKVTVVSRRDPSTDKFTATAIVVHPQRVSAMPLERANEL
jgi:hypothetical protein